MTLLRSGSATDTGLVRSVNQDLAVETSTLFAVADGMGGHAGGEVAARLAVDALSVAFGRQPTGAGLSQAVTEANTVVFQHSQENPELRGMGTTLTALSLVNEGGQDVLALVNVGDSRSYRFHGGELTSAEASVHPHRHILTRALGVASGVAVDLWKIQPVRGDLNDPAGVARRQRRPTLNVRSATSRLPRRRRSWTAWEPSRPPRRAATRKRLRGCRPSATASPCSSRELRPASRRMFRNSRLRPRCMTGRARARWCGRARFRA